MPYIGKQPANVPVTADDIPNDSITAAKIVDAAITIDDIGPNAVGNSEMADDAIGLNELSATGTTNTSTFLRGDNSWAVPPATDISGKLNLSGGAMTGAITTNSTFDGVDIATRDAVLTSTTTTANAALPKAGGTMTGNIAHAGAFTLDVGSEINLDSDSGYVYLKDGGTSVGLFKLATSDFVIKSPVQDKDIIFQGNDGGSTITALTLDMSDAGAATFNNHVTATGNIYTAGNVNLTADNKKLRLGAGEDLQIFHSGSNSIIRDSGTGGLYIEASQVFMTDAAGNENMFKATENGAVELYHNNVKTFETTAEGAKVTGHLRLNNSQQIQFGGSASHIDGDSGYMAFDVNSSERMRINSSGNVGIGTTSPATATGFNSPAFEISGSNPSIILSKTGADSLAIVNHASYLKILNDTDDRAIFHIHQDALANSFIMESSGKSVFYNNLVGEVLTVYNTHNASSGDFGLYIKLGSNCHNTNSRFITAWNGTQGTTFQALGNGNVINFNNSYGAQSDLKLKENIALANSQWDDIKALQIKKYSLKSENSDAANRLGVIAQDLETSGMNGLVEETKDYEERPDSDWVAEEGQTEEDRPNLQIDLGTTTKSVKYSILYMKSVKALQEAIIKIEDLEARITTLEKA